MSKKVAIVGGGLGGISAALLLSNLGFKVDLYERNATLGGKISEVQENGFRFDTGPSLLTLKNVVNSLFFQVGEKLEDYIDLIPISPISKNFFDDGTIIKTYSDIESTYDEISKLSKRDAESFRKYISYAEKIYNNAADIFLYQPMHEVIKLIKESRFPSLLNALKIDSFRTMHKANSHFFENKKIIQVFDRFATYNGSSPYEVPATLNIIAYVELILGGYYIKGGIYRLIEALEKLLMKNNVAIHKNTKVNKILHSNGKFRGIEVNKEKLDYDYCIANSDIVYTFENLIEGFQSRKEKLKKLEPSLSGIVFLWGVSQENDELEHHNVLFSANYKEEFEFIFNHKQVINDPTVYIAITSKADKHHAPKNHENWFLLINSPYLSENQNWDEMIKKTRNSVIKKLTNIINFSDKNIAYEKIISPLEHHNQYLSNKGSIYGISSNDRMSAFKRYPNRSREIENLYFAGGSVHPGGGIPLVILSGANCTELIAEKENIKFRFINQ